MQVLPQAPPFPARRLAEFTEPRPDDVCLEVTAGEPALAPIIGPLVHDLTTATADTLPDGPFTLVTAPLALARATDPAALAGELLRVCEGRVVLAEIIRGRQGRQGLIDLLKEAGGTVRRLDVFTIERPVEAWLARGEDTERFRDELAAEIDGGPSTGAHPRLIGDELWFAQSWAYIAVTSGDAAL